ncbi:MAG TPA: response regulator [Bryobacteraceae bacterium]|nr:response regulator [Bryobacteraceae bacterium]
MRHTLTVLLIEDSPDYANLVQRWLGEQVAISFSVQWEDTLASGLRRLSQGGVDVVLMDLGLPDSAGLNTFLKVRPHAVGLPIIVMSAAEDEGFAIQTVEEGAQDYLIKSSSNAETLLRALRFAVARQDKQKASVQTALDKTRLIGVVGASGGVGTTTLACHLARELRHQTGDEVLLMDLDLSGGLVSFLMKTDTDSSVFEAAANVGRLDERLWTALVRPTPDEIDILGSVVLDRDAIPTYEEIGLILNLLPSRYKWVVADFGRLHSLHRSLLTGATATLLVTSPEVLALVQAKRAIAYLSSDSSLNTLCLIANNGSERTDVTHDSLEATLGVPVYATLPYDPRNLREAHLGGGGLRSASALRNAIAGIARKLAGVEQQRRRSTPIPAGLRRDAEIRLKLPALRA